MDEEQFGKVIWATAKPERSTKDANIEVLVLDMCDSLINLAL